MVKRIKGQVTVFCDVDETLIMMDMFMEPKPPDIDEKHLVKLTNKNGVEVLGLPHYRHIAMLKQFSARGFTIIVWSAGKEEWAYKAVLALGLENVVDYTMSKADWFFDDKKAHEFLKEGIRIYLNPSNPLKDHNFPDDDIDSP